MIMNCSIVIIINLLSSLNISHFLLPSYPPSLERKLSLVFIFVSNTQAGQATSLTALNDNKPQPKQIISSVQVPGSRIQGHFLNIQLLHCPGNSQESWLGYTWLHSHWAKPICRVSYILCNKYSIRICTNYQLLQISSRPDDWLRITGDVRTFQRIMKRWSVSGSGKHLGALYFPFIRNLFTRQ